MVDELYGSAVGFGDGAVLELSDPEVAGLTIDEGDDAVLVEGAENGVAFEVSDAGSVCGTRRSLGDVTFTGEATTGVIGAVAFTAFLAGLAKELVAGAPTAFVTPDIAVDGLVADAQASILAEPT